QVPRSSSSPSTALFRSRAEDPYRDLSVIDARGPRTLQTFVAILTVLALVTGFWPLVAVAAAQLVIGLVFGRKACLPCLLWFEVLDRKSTRLNSSHVKIS